MNDLKKKIDCRTLLAYNSLFPFSLPAPLEGLLCNSSRVHYTYLTYKCQLFLGTGHYHI